MESSAGQNPMGSSCWLVPKSTQSLSCPIKVCTCFHSTAESLCGEFLYVFGGEVKSRVAGPNNSPPKVAKKLVNQLAVYSAIHQEWKVLEPAGGLAPPPRKGAALVCDGASLYLFGGVGTSAYFNDFWGFDINARQWRDLTDVCLQKSRQVHDLPAAPVDAEDDSSSGDSPTSPAAKFSTFFPERYPSVRAYHTAHYYKATDSGAPGFVYVLGGYPDGVDDADTNSPLNKIWRVNLQSMLWECVAYEGLAGTVATKHHPGHRFGHTSSFKDGSIFLMGGQYKGRLNVSNVWELDLKDGKHQWKLHEAAPPGKPASWDPAASSTGKQGAPKRTYASGVICGSSWLIHGGSSDNMMFSDFWEFNLVSKVWLGPFAELQSPWALEGHSASLIKHPKCSGTSIMLIGGSSADIESQKNAILEAHFNRDLTDVTAASPLVNFIVESLTARVIMELEDALGQLTRLNQSALKDLQTEKMKSEQYKSRYEDIALQNEGLQDMLNLMKAAKQHEPGTDSKTTDTVPSNDMGSGPLLASDAKGKQDPDVIALKKKYRDLALKYNEQLSQKKVLKRRMDKVDALTREVSKYSDKYEQTAHTALEILRTATTLNEAKPASKYVDSVSVHLRKLHFQVFELKESLETNDDATTGTGENGLPQEGDSNLEQPPLTTSGSSGHLTERITTTTETKTTTTVESESKSGSPRVPPTTKAEVPARAEVPTETEKTKPKSKKTGAVPGEATEQAKKNPKTSNVEQEDEKVTRIVNLNSAGSKTGETTDPEGVKVAGTKKTTKKTTVIRKIIGPDGVEMQEIISQDVDTKVEEDVIAQEKLRLPKGRTAKAAGKPDVPAELLVEDAGQENVKPQQKSTGTNDPVQTDRKKPAKEGGETKTKIKTETKSETKTETESKTKTETESKTKTETESKTTETKSEPKPAAVAAAAAEPKKVAKTAKVTSGEKVVSAVKVPPAPPVPSQNSERNQFDQEQLLTKKTITTVTTKKFVNGVEVDGSHNVQEVVENLGSSRRLVENSADSAQPATKGSKVTAGETTLERKSSKTLDVREETTTRTATESQATLEKKPTKKLAEKLVSSGSPVGVARAVPVVCAPEPPPVAGVPYRMQCGVAQPRLVKSTH